MFKNLIKKVRANRDDAICELLSGVSRRRQVKAGETPGTSSEHARLATCYAWAQSPGGVHVAIWCPVRATTPQLPAVLDDHDGGDAQSQSKCRVMCRTSTFSFTACRRVYGSESQACRP